MSLYRRQLDQDIDDDNSIDVLRSLISWQCDQYIDEPWFYDCELYFIEEEL